MCAYRSRGLDFDNYLTHRATTGAYTGFYSGDYGLNLNIWASYIGAILLLMSTPGPSHLMMLSNSLAHGFRRSVFTALGDLTANLLQMLAVSLGLAAVIAASPVLLQIVKWFGVVYLSYLGIQQFRSAGKSLQISDSEAQKSIRRLWIDGFVASATNPKAIVFFASLFPLFITEAQPLWPQVLILGLTYLTIDSIFLSGYGVAATWLNSRMTGSRNVWLPRIAGTFMIAAAILLGLRSPGG